MKLRKFLIIFQLLFNLINSNNSNNPLSNFNNSNNSSNSSNNLDNNSSNKLKLFSYYSNYYYESDYIIIDIINKQQIIYEIFPFNFYIIENINNYYSNYSKNIFYFLNLNYNNNKKDNNSNNNDNYSENKNYYHFINYSDINIFELFKDNLNKELEKNYKLFPAGIRVYDNNGLILYNAMILQLKRSLFYVRNEYESISQDMIEMFLQSGYNVYWHVSTGISSENLQNIKVNITNEIIPDSNFILINLIAIPESLSTIVFHNLGRFIPRDRLFPYKDGLYHISQYGRYIVSKEFFHFEDNNYNSTNNNSKFMTRDIQILSTKSKIEKYKKLGYSIKLLKQKQGRFNENKEWIESDNEIQTDFYPSIPLYYPPNLIPKKDTTITQSICEFIEITTTLEPLILNLSNETNNTQIFVNYRFLSNLSSSKLGIVSNYICNGLYEQYPNLLFQSCLLYFTMLYEDMNKINKCKINIVNSTNFLSLSLPFTFNDESILCTEPIWCSHTIEFQQRLSYWQTPRIRTTENYISTEREYKGCNNNKYLVYEPNFQHEKGIAGMLFELGLLLRFSICHGRILYLTPHHLKDNYYLQHSKWIHYLCQSSLFECFFESITECELLDEEIQNAPVLKDDRQLLTYPLRDSKVVKVIQIPSKSHCATCYDTWTGNVEIFDQLHIGILGYVAISVNHSITNTAIFDILDPTKKELSGFSIFMDNNSLFWMAEMIRYIFQPQVWFRYYIQQYIENHLISYPLLNTENKFNLNNKFYASFHLTSNTIPLINKYFEILLYYSPHIQHIFISIDSSLYSILSSLISDIYILYPNYQFYYLLTSNLKSDDNSFDSFLYSIASLEISTKGKTFIGNLNNGWDNLINIFQRTRGDGGYDYYSINSTTSSYSICIDELT